MSSSLSRSASPAASLGGDDRQNDASLDDLRVAHRHHAGAFGALGARGAAAEQRGDDAGAALAQALPDGGAHLAGRNDGNQIGHAFAPTKHPDGTQCRRTRAPAPPAFAHASREVTSRIARMQGAALTSE